MLLPSKRLSIIACIAVTFASVGCATQTDDESEQTEGAASTAESIEVFVTGYARATSPTEARDEGSGDTAAIDEEDARLKSLLLTQELKDTATAQMRAECAKIAFGGHFDLVGELESQIRAGRPETDTEFVVSVKYRQDCRVPRSTVQANVAALVDRLADDPFSVERRAVIEVGSPAAPKILDEIQERITADGKLDLREDEQRGVINFTINHVVQLAKLLADLSTPSTDPRTTSLLTKLHEAVKNAPNGSTWAAPEIEGVIARVRPTQQ
jgi:hypothetical protein